MSRAEFGASSFLGTIRMRYKEGQVAAETVKRVLDKHGKERTPEACRELRENNVSPQDWKAMSKISLMPKDIAYSLGALNYFLKPSKRK